MFLHYYFTITIIILKNGLKTLSFIAITSGTIYLPAKLFIVTGQCKALCISLLLKCSRCLWEYWLRSDKILGNQIST